MWYVPYTLDAYVYGAIEAATVAGCVAIALDGARRRAGARRMITRLLWAGAGFVAAGVAYSAMIVFRQAAEMHDARECHDHMSVLSKALGRYIQVTGTYPRAERWDTDLVPYLPRRAGNAVFTCPEARSRFGYAYNAWLSGTPVDSVPYPTRTVLIFESNADRRAAVNGRGSVAWDRHLGRPSFLMADGSVYARTQQDRMIWRPMARSPAPGDSPSDAASRRSGP